MINIPDNIKNDIAKYYSLTAKQKEVYTVIANYINTEKISPSIKEISKRLGKKTPGTILGIISRLEQKGLVKRKAKVARSIQLVCDDSKYIKPIYIAEINTINSRNISEILSVYNIIRYHPFSSHFIDTSGTYFIVSCNDNCLSEKGVNKNDLLLINKTKTIKDNDIVLVYCNKKPIVRYYFKNINPKHITLKFFENSDNFEEYRKKEVDILGKVVLVIKRYISTIMA